MNTQSSTIREPFEAQRVAPVSLSATRPFFWSVKRELWENRSTYIAPLVAAAVFLFGFLINMLAMRRGVHAMWPFDPAQQHRLLTTRYELAGAMIMGTALIVGIFYSLDALYGERRDRSILFWKSLPVSDVTAVLSKVTIPLVILPLLSFAITIATQWMMLLLSSVILLGSGVNIATLWRDASFVHVPLVLLYHLITVHGLWYAPMYGWLLLISAWAPRAPFLWAALPPFVIYGVEKIAFNTSYFLGLLQNRLTGPQDAMAPDGMPKDFMATLIPHHFFSEPGLWIGLGVAALFLAGAVRLRRYQGPI
ncbi:MAG: ABC transporter permease [Acidobacteria bacterium]|nr:MAG: ABC transporter permease [Acidobacteriota bacterium]